MRTKKVFSPDELAHVWARQSQAEGRTPTNNFYFYRDTIYSYGSHFPIAKILPSGVVLCTYRTYSNTTSKHVWAVKHAVNHKEIVYCSNPNSDPWYNLTQESRNIEAQKDISEAPRRRQATRDNAKSEAKQLVERARAYCLAVGTTLEKELRALRKSTDLGQQKACDLFMWAIDMNFDYAGAILKRNAAIKKARTKAEKLKAENQKKFLAEWLNGEGDAWLLDYSMTPVMMRLRKIEDGDKIVETTHGAKVSYDAAKLLYRMIIAGKDIKGHKIDGYTVISLNGVLKIGCHEIPRTEIDRFAALMNW